MWAVHRRALVAGPACLALATASGAAVRAVCDGQVLNTAHMLGWYVALGCPSRGLAAVLGGYQPTTLRLQSCLNSPRPSTRCLPPRCGQEPAAEARGQGGAARRLHHGQGLQRRRPHRRGAAQPGGGSGGGGGGGCASCGPKWAAAQHKAMIAALFLALCPPRLCGPRRTPLGTRPHALSGAQPPTHLPTHPPTPSIPSHPTLPAPVDR